MKKIRVVSCITTIMIMALIFFFSSQNSDESSAVSKSITLMIVKAAVSLFIHDGSQVETIAELIHNMVRKFAHFTIYTGLGISVFTMLYSNFRKTKPKTVLAAVIFCGAYSITDEFHQMFVSGRTGRIKDVAIDTSGALFGALICCFILWAVYEFNKRRKK